MTQQIGDGGEVMGFTDQQPHTVTAKDLVTPWGGGKNGKYFRCYLCGHKFKLGDVFRWVFSNRGPGNFMVCESCDGEDVIDRWAALYEEFKASSTGRFWRFTRDD